jgi:Zn-dependent M28 family amino/carboxypeptidase
MNEYWMVIVLFGTNPPKPAVLDREALPRLVAIANGVNAALVREHLSAVVGPQNRITAQEKMAQTEDYISKTFKKFGWKAERQEYETRARVAPGVYQDLSGVNVVATKRGKSADRIIIVGAHYDTVDNTPGADDNGTGIAALLELARVLGKHTYNKTLVLVAFDMEEIGLLGSKVFVQKLPSDAVVEGAIVFDAIGYFDEKENSQRIPSGLSLLYRQQAGWVKRNRFRGNFIAVIHNGKSKKLASLFAGANQSLGESIPLVFMRDPLDLPALGPVLRRLFPALKDLLRSDHVHFWRAKLPAIQLTDSANFRNSNYHRPTDVIDTINFTAVEKVVQTVVITVSTLAEIQE